MAELTIKSRILFRDDTAANWSTTNPILKNGEPGWDSTNYRLKIGNDVNAWSDLKWATPNVDIYTDNGLIGIDYANENKNGETRTFKLEAYANPANVESSTNHGAIAQFLFQIDGTSPGGSDMSNSYYLSTTNFYPNKVASLGSASKIWSSAYIGSVFVSDKLATAESSLKIEIGSTTAGLTLSNNEILPNRNGTSSTQGISLGSSTMRFNTGFFNKIDIQAIGVSKNITISQRATGPSDNGLTITEGTGPNYLTINPTEGWIGNGLWGTSGAIFFSQTGVRLGANYSNHRVDFILNKADEAAIVPILNATTASPDFSLGKDGYNFSRVYGKNLIMNSEIVDESKSEISSLAGNIIYSDTPLNFQFKTWKSFKITGFNYDAKTFTLDSVEGLEVGDTYSTACTGITYYNYGTITAINGTVVTVSAVPSAAFESYLTPTPSYNHMCWFIKDKPNVGSINMTYFNEVGKSNFIMVTNPKIYGASAPLTDIVIFNKSNFFAFGEGLQIPVNSSYTTTTFKIGKYDNDTYGNYPFVIGWGSSDTDRKNIFYINNSGSVYAGNIYPNTAVSSTNYLGTSGNKWDYGYINNLYTGTTYLNNSWSTLPSDTNQRALLYKNYGSTSVGDIDDITTPGLYTLRTGITGGPYCSKTGSGGSTASSYFTVLCMATDNSSLYRPMIGIKENDNNLYVNNLYVKGSTTGDWKRIGWGYGTTAPSGTANTGDIYIQYDA